MSETLCLDSIRRVIREELAAHDKSKHLLLEMLENRRQRIVLLENAFIRLRDCDWTITLPDRMDAVRKIAREALEEAGK